MNEHERYTNRYVEAATAALPIGQREDHARELRASIADQIDARVATGEQEAAAERVVLTELGDPARLAAEYSERPLFLLGPRVYADWRRLIALLLWIVVPGGMFAGAIAPALEGDVGGAIGGAVVVGLLAGLHVCFWTTLVFALIDRAGVSAGSWSPEQLPPLRAYRLRRGEVILGIALIALMVLAIVWDGTVGFVRDAGNGGSLPILHPDIWPWSAIVVAFLLGTNTLFQSLMLLDRRSGWWLAGASIAVTVIGAAIVVGLVGAGKLINPAFVEYTGIGAEPARTIGVLLIIVALLLSAWGIIDTVRRMRSPISS